MIQTASYPSLAYATVKRTPESENERVHLTLDNIEATSELLRNVSISPKQLAAKDLVIKKGDRLLVALYKEKLQSDELNEPAEKHNKHRLNAILLSDDIVTDIPAQISGRMSLGINPRFEPHHPNITQEFRISASPTTRVIERGEHCRAEIPFDFDPLNPMVNLDIEQDIDKRTGKPVTEILAKKHGFKPEHDDATLQTAKTIARTKRINKSSRIDLTDLNFLAIDPVGARDRDDALYVAKISGGWRSITAIADVAYYVRYDSDVDKAAFERGTTLYLRDGQMPYHMLPRRLVDKLSLNQDVERPVLYCEKIYDDNGNKLSCEFNWGVIKVKHAMTYEKYYDLTYQNSPITKDLHEFFELQKSKKTYTLDLKDEFEGVSSFSGDSKSPVEWLMIDTNQEAAFKALTTQTPYLYRNNGPTADIRAYKKLRKKLQKLGLELPHNPRNCSIEELKDAIKAADSFGIKVHANELIQNKLFDRAVYSTKNLGHFATGLQYYSHFTSPIRRYPDIINHRAMHSIIGTKYGFQDEEIKRLDQRAEHLTHKNRATKHFEKDLKNFHAIADLERLSGKFLRANLLYVNKNSAEIILPSEHGLHLSLNAKELAALNCKINTQENQLIFMNDQNAVQYRAHRDTKLRARIADVDTSKGTWHIDALDPA